MKKILCFGDSNTFGFNPENGTRFNKESRWSGILASLLFPEYEIIEEGMNNRTGFFKNPEGLKQSGGEYLSVFLQNHGKFDICILSLGTNDAQIFYSLDEAAAEKGLKNLISIVKNVNSDAIIVPPVKITEDFLHSGFSAMFDKNSIQKIQRIFPVFEKVAKNNNCFYFDFNKFVQPSKYDGIHYTKESHRIIAENFAGFIAENIK